MDEFLRSGRIAHLRCSRPHRLAPGHHTGGHHGHGMRELSVAEIALRHGGLRVVDDGRDIGDVGDMRDIDVAHITRAHAVGWHIDLARRQREPAHGRAAPGADGHRHAHVRPAHPADQGRRIHRPCHARARRPAPGGAKPDPAAVVEGRKTPGGVVHPGPAPGANPGPVASAVGRPARAHGARNPQRPVLRVFFPAAMAIQVFGTGHLG